ncbi:LURP-one-related 15 [Spatholobus suberectus]|nr:LURP-one-related 15 [Spatholobus suberectus]
MNMSDTPISTQLAQNSTEHQVEQIKIQGMDSRFIQDIKLSLEIYRTIHKYVFTHILYDLEAAEMQNPQIDLTRMSMSPTIPITRPQYCTPIPILLEIVRTVHKFGFSHKFSVININNNIIFNLKMRSFSIHKQFILFDDDKNPIVTLHKKRMTAHNRWQVFKGKSDQIDDLLFNVKQHHIIQLKAKWDVFLATNTKEKVCDFMVERSSFDGSYSVCVQSGNIIAKISKYIAPGRIGSSKESAMVSVKANIDSAFIVALIIVILSLE